jgi:hypothetical protein
MMFLGWAAIFEDLLNVEVCRRKLCEVPAPTRSKFDYVVLLVMHLAAKIFRPWREKPGIAKNTTPGGFRCTTATPLFSG